MPRINLHDIANTLDDTLDAEQTHLARAGGTVAVWSEAATGIVICVTDVAPDGDPEVFSPDHNDGVETDRLFIGVYPSYDSYMDGDMYSDQATVPASMDDLAEAVRTLNEKHSA